MAGGPARTWRCSKFVDAIRRRPPIEVYDDGEMARDFTCIDDLVEAVVGLADVIPAETNRVADDTLSANAPSRAVNIGGRQPILLMDFIRTNEAGTGIEARLDMLPMHARDAPGTFADAALLKRLTESRPRRRPAVGVQAFVDWHERYF